MRPRRFVAARQDVETALLMTRFLQSDEETDSPSLFTLLTAWLVDWEERKSVPRGPVPSSRVWADTVLPELDDLRFRAWTRVDKVTFGVIHDLIASNPVFVTTRVQRPQAAVAEQLAIALFKLGSNGNGSAIRQTAGHWGWSEGHMWNCTRRVIQALSDLVPQHIVWPSAHEREAEGRDAAERAGLAGVVGKVDGTDVVLFSRPGGQLRGDEFFNRKKRYAINLTAVCNRSLQFTFVTTGWPASVHDSRIWTHTDVHRQPQRYFDAGQYLVGDAAYPLGENLIIPYKKPISNLRDNRRFNKQLSSIRIQIEHAFGMLKG